MKRLYPNDYFNEDAKSCDDDYLYYQDSASLFRSTPLAGLNNAVVTQQKDIEDYTVIAAGQGDVRHIHVTAAGSLLLIGRSIATNLYYMWRSDDQGATWSADGSHVLELGLDDSGVHQPGRNMLGNQNMCNVTLDDGSAAILLAEYQAVDASPHNIKVWISKDDGLTWTSMWSVGNSDGEASNQPIRHFHCVQQDPYTKKIVVVCGDSDAMNGIVIGPNNGDWSAINDTAPKDISETGFVAAGNSQKYRGYQLAFDENYIYSYADTTEAANQGIWRFSKTDLTATKVHAVAREGGGMFRTQQGTLLACDIVDSNNDATMTEVNIYASEDGETWKNIAKAALENGWSGVARTFSIIFQDKFGRIFFSGGVYNSIPGKADKHVTVVKEQGNWFDALGAEIIAPVYYVSDTGTDSHNQNTFQGFRESAPWATLKYALEGDRITIGARVLLADGIHTTNASTLDYQSNTIPAKAGQTTVVEGRISGQTTLYYDADNTGTGFNVGLNDGDLTFRNLRVISSTGTTLFDTTGYTDTLTNSTTQGPVRWR